MGDSERAIGFENLTGAKFGSLMVLTYKKGKPGKWECLCDCGKITLVRAGDLKRGSIKSCGCKRHLLPHKDLVGLVFTRLTVVALVQRNPLKWECVCVCGERRVVFGPALTQGRTKSCGCLARELAASQREKHGKSFSPVYQSWKNMLQRCNNKNAKSYHNYGGRGIRVSEQWMTFEAFYKDMGEPPTEKHQIDRIDNDGNYCKENCRWVTKKQNSRNKRNTIWLEINGEFKPCCAWAEETGIPAETIVRRVQANWPIDKILIPPKKVNGRYGWP